MHNKRYILLFTVLALFSCGKDRIEDPEFGEGDYPRIFDIQNAFTSPVRILNEGETASFKGLLFSPGGKVKVTWKVNGEQKSTDTTFSFTPAGGGEFDITLEAELNGLKSNRAIKVLVKPNTYTPKPFTKVVMAYMSAAGTAENIDWEYVTHVAFQAGRVSADGTVDLSAGETNQRMDELVTRGHIAGTPVLLGLSGRLSGLDGWALYEANDFGEAIRTPASRAALVTTVVNYVTTKKLDGVDIMMSDVNSGAYAQNVGAIAPFINELKAALPASAIITATVTCGWQHWDYPNLSAATWVNVRAFEDNLHVGPGVVRGQPSSLAYMQEWAKNWNDFHVPAAKLVIGIPAFGLRYNELDANGNNASWGSYDYVPYKTILGFDPQAADKEMVNNAFGVYYNGKPLAKQKGDWLKTSPYKGAYLWAVDYDSQDDKSILRVLFNALK